MEGEPDPTCGALKISETRKKIKKKVILIFHVIIINYLLFRVRIIGVMKK